MDIRCYHAHVYFDEDNLEEAKKLTQAAGERFNIRVGRLHSRPVGPHPRGSCQLSFKAEILGEVVTWLLLNRSGLTVLLHGLSGDELRDHTEFVFWLGAAEDLDLSAL